MKIESIKSEHQLRSEILAATRDLETAGTSDRIKALERLAALRRELAKLELEQLRKKGK